MTTAKGPDLQGNIAKHSPELPKLVTGIREKFWLMERFP